MAIVHWPIRGIMAGSWPSKQNLFKRPAETVKADLGHSKDDENLANPNRTCILLRP
jgi:hypothetical protein